MTAMPAGRHGFGAWAPQIHARRLGDYARPAGGRVRRQVLFSVVPAVWMNHGARQAELLLDHATGPTRCSPIVVQALFTDDQIDQAFTDSMLGDVPVAQLTRARANFDAAPHGWVLLVGHCRVLWRQRAAAAELS